MAFTVTKCDVGGSTANGYHYEYLCESADDISDLPTGASSTEISRPAPGSLAYIESDSSARYILKISREWSEYPMAGGGGGGTSGGYDAVFRFDTADRGATWTGTLESGTFEAVQAKAEAGEMFSVGAYYRGPEAEGTDISIMAIDHLVYTSYVIAPLTGSVIFRASCLLYRLSTDYYLDCTWDSDGTITVMLD